MNFFDPNYYLEEEVSWLFNINHFYLALGVIAFIIFALYIAPKKNETLIKINKVFLSLLLIILESGRIIYNCYSYKLDHGSLEGIDTVSLISFQMCATMTWSFAFILLLSTFLKKNNMFLKYNYNFFFGGALIGAASCFVNPLIVDGRKPIWHFKNVETILVHSLLILIPLLLIKWGDFKVRFKDVWMNLVGFMIIGSISMSVSIATNHDFAFSKTIPLEGIPKILFPFPQLVIMLLMFAGDIVLYLLFELYRYLKLRKNNEDLSDFKADFDFKNYQYYIGTISSCLLSITLFLVISYLVGEKQTNLGYLCLIPGVYLISLLILIEYKYKNKNQNILIKTNGILDYFLMINPIILIGFIINNSRKKLA